MRQDTRRMERVALVAPAGTSAPPRRLRCGAAVAAALMALAAAAPLQAQAGDGYLFGRPQGSFTLRGGYAQARAGNDIFDDLGLEKRGYRGLSGGISAAVSLTPSLDVSFDAGYLLASTPSHYRSLVDNANQEIEQTTELRRVPLTVNAKLYLGERGRSIGRFAWIPTSVAPWVGAGGGAMWYRFRQDGDFVDVTTNGVFHDTFNSDGFTPMAQAMAGLDVTLTPRLAATGDARYLWAQRPGPGADYSGYQPFDLSGVALSLGLTVRL